MFDRVFTFVFLFKSFIWELYLKGIAPFSIAPLFKEAINTKPLLTQTTYFHNSTDDIGAFSCFQQSLKYQVTSF